MTEPLWQERLTVESPPEVVVEHQLRYRLLADLLGASASWIDLGCGSGVAAASTLYENLPDQVVLVDLEEGVAQDAAARLQAKESTVLAGDLSDPQFLRRLEGQLSGLKQPIAVSAFEVVEHLPNFAPLLDLLVTAAYRYRATVVLSVPNDAFFAVENPHHKTRWGDGAFAELLSALPAERIVLKQLHLTGSAVVLEPLKRPAAFSTAVTVSPDLAEVPSHFLV